MDLRLNLLRSLLQKRELQYKKKVKSRFNRLQNKLRKHRDDQVKTIRHNLKRNLRKLYRKYCDSQQSRKPDIIEGHIGYKSDLYESQMRYGERFQRQYEKLEKQFLSESYEREYIIDYNDINFYIQGVSHKVLRGVFSKIEVI